MKFNISLPVPDTLFKILRRLELHLVENHTRLTLKTRFFSVAMKHHQTLFLWFEGLRTNLASSASLFAR